MNRRIDQQTAEIIDIVLLTRAAFGMDYALRYVQLAGLLRSLLYKVLARPERRLRHNDGLGYVANPEGRRYARRSRQK